MQTLTHEVAERLRSMMGAIQVDILNDSNIPVDTATRLIEKISSDGFYLVDQLEGVIR